MKKTAWRNGLALPGAVALLGFIGIGVAVLPVGEGTGGSAAGYDIIIENGVLYDGSGQPGYVGDIGIVADQIVAIGDLEGAKATQKIDAEGKAVAPGFINMLSWGAESLIEDGRGLSDIMQGVTLEVFGEGFSMGPLSEPMKEFVRRRQTNIKYEIEWSTLGEFLEYLEDKGVSPNVASFVGATTVRVKHLGPVNRKPSPAQLAAMQADVAHAMQEGAMGVGSALIYPPGLFAGTDELAALAKTAGEHGGSYISHMRSEGDRLIESIDEVLEIGEKSGTPVEIYHLKAAGRANWGKMDTVIARINEARAAGVDIRANMYPYIAGSTGLSAAMPPWVQEGGVEAWMKRLRAPELRARLIADIETPNDKWENVYLASGGAEGVRLVGFKTPSLQHYTGKTLAEVARLRGQIPAEAIIDLIVEDGSRVEAVYFMMSEENLKKQIEQSWVSFQSDAPILAPEGVFLEQSVHPRAYGTFSRLLGKYVRDEQVISLSEAVRRLTSLPAANLNLKGRGSLKVGHFADIVIFDPALIQDHATYANPHQLSSGVSDVFVNGIQVIKGGQHTGEKPGRFVRGPGYMPELSLDN